MSNCLRASQLLSILYIRINSNYSHSYSKFISWIHRIYIYISMALLQHQNDSRWMNLKRIQTPQHNLFYIISIVRVSNHFFLSAATFVETTQHNITSYAAAKKAPSQRLFLRFGFIVADTRYLFIYLWSDWCVFVYSPVVVLCSFHVRSVKYFISVDSIAGVHFLQWMHIEKRIINT